MLEIAHLPRKGGLRQIESLRGATYASRLGHDEEVSQMTQLESRWNAELDGTGVGGRASHGRAGTLIRFDAPKDIEHRPRDRTCVGATPHPDNSYRDGPIIERDTHESTRDPVPHSARDQCPSATRDDEGNEGVSSSDRADFLRLELPLLQLGQHHRPHLLKGIGVSDNRLATHLVETNRGPIRERMIRGEQRAVQHISELRLMMQPSVVNRGPRTNADIE
jgi:hypothetical protein